MKASLINDNGQKTYALIFDTGDEVAEGLLNFAKEKNLSASHFTAIGAFRDVTLGYFDIEKKEYHKNPIDEQVEVVSLVGDVAMKGDEPKVHAHVVVARRDGTAYGGHLMKAHVRPTLEVILTESPAHLQRTHDEATGLALIDIDSTNAEKKR